MKKNDRNVKKKLLICLATREMSLAKLEREMGLCKNSIFNKLSRGSITYLALLDILDFLNIELKWESAEEE